WALVSFQAAANGRYTVSEGKRPPVRNAVTCKADGDQLHLSNGVIDLTLSKTGAGPVSSLTAFGRAIMPEPDELRVCVDMADTRRGRSRERVILEQSDMRTRVRVQGGQYHVNGTRRMSYHLGVELWANSPSGRLDYQFFPCEPNRPTIE